MFSFTSKFLSPNLKQAFVKPSSVQLITSRRFHISGCKYYKKSDQTFENIKLELFSKSDCGLCSKAKNVISEVLKDPEVEGSKIQVIVTDITLAKNKEWWDLYCFDVPVLHLTHENQKEPVKFFHRMNKSKIIESINNK